MSRADTLKSRAREGARPPSTSPARERGDWGTARGRIAVVLFAILLATACSSTPTPWVQASRRTVVSVLTTNGTVEPIETRALTAQTSGRIVSVEVKTGEDVKQGQVIATVDDREAQSTLQQALARLSASQAELKGLERGLGAIEKLELENRLASLKKLVASTNLEARVVERLAKAGAVPRTQFEGLQRKLEDLAAEQDLISKKLAAKPAAEAIERAKALVQEAAAAVQAARSRAGSSAIRAPIDGRVYALSAEPNDFVSPGSVVGQIGRLDRVRVVILVDEPELGRVALGQSVEIRSEALPGRVWESTVERLPSAIEEAGSRRAGKLLTELDNPDRALLPNLSVEVRIIAGRAENALALPRAALEGSADQPFVWLAESGMAARREVTTGVRGPAYVEIRSGLSESDQVLLPVTELAEGQPVTLAAASNE